MPRNYEKSVPSAVGSETHSISGTKHAKVMSTDTNITDAQQSAKCLQQLLFIAVSALAEGREYISDTELEYHSQANLEYPVIKKDVKRTLAAQLRRYVFDACNLITRGELAEFRLQVVKIATNEIFEEIGFIFEYHDDNTGTDEEAGAFGLDRRPRKSMNLGTVASIEAARARLLATVNTFSKGAKRLRDLIQLDPNHKGTEITVRPWFLCRQRTNYFDKELVPAAAGSEDQDKGRVRGKAAAADRDAEKVKLLAQGGFHPFCQTPVTEVSRLAGGTYIRMIQMKTDFHSMTIYGKVPKSSMAEWGKPSS